MGISAYFPIECFAEETVSAGSLSLSMNIFEMGNEGQCIWR